MPRGALSPKQKQHLLFFVSSAGFFSVFASSSAPRPKKISKLQAERYHLRLSCEWLFLRVALPSASECRREILKIGFIPCAA